MSRFYAMGISWAKVLSKLKSFLNMGKLNIFFTLNHWIFK